jgi:propanol-preferring alcohol dehydrogenase
MGVHAPPRAVEPVARSAHHLTMTRCHAMVLDRPGAPLRAADLDLAPPGPGQVLMRVAACGVCRTDLHLADGDLAPHHHPSVPGHEIVGRVEAVGAGVELAVGARVGVPWLGWTCGDCAPCRAGRENLCERARFTGWQIDGGYATHALADARYCLPVPDAYDDVAAAPLLCAGLIGYRALGFAGDARSVALYGFGAAAHIVAQVAVHQGRTVYAFTKPGDVAGQDFARSLGAAWAGGSDEAPPEPVEAALIFAPVGALVPTSLRHTRPGGTVVCAGIHMSEIPAFPYEWLWRERTIRSVANLTRADGLAFMALAPKVPMRTHTSAYPLAEANRALDDVRAGRVEGAAVLVMNR